MSNEIKLQLESWRGYSAYEVAVNNGFEGTEQEWLDSLKGRDGGVKTVNGKAHDENGNVKLAGEDITVGANDNRTLKDVTADVDKLTDTFEITDDAIDIGGKYLDNARFR